MWFWFLAAFLTSRTATTWTVGYLSPFEGMTPKPATEFSWARGGFPTPFLTRNLKIPPQSFGVRMLPIPTKFLRGLLNSKLLAFSSSKANTLGNLSCFISKHQHLPTKWNSFSSKGQSCLFGGGECHVYLWKMASGLYRYASSVSWVWLFLPVPAWQGSSSPVPPLLAFGR